MLIVVTNNNNISLESNERIMSYTSFAELAFGDGLSLEDDVIINADDTIEEQYILLKDAGIEFFTLGNKPSYTSFDSIVDWSHRLQSNYTMEEPPKPSQSEVFNNTNNSYQEGVATVDDSQKVNDDITNLLNSSWNDDIPSNSGSSEAKEAKIFVFGSSKGGTGKTFTSIISTYRYAKTHPHERIALVDFDIIDGQVGISIHKQGPTMKNYLVEYQKGYKDFRTMSNFCVKGNKVFPQNVDFYLAPSNGIVIRNDEFWMNVINNVIENYDVVIFDTGIDYLNLAPISYAYKIADKINLITTTSIKSVNSVKKQIEKLKGAVKNPVFSVEDELEPRLNIIITQMVSSNKMNKTIYQNLASEANICATFGVITESVSQAEFYGEWDVFDGNPGVLKALDNIMSL